MRADNPADVRILRGPARTAQRMAQWLAENRAGGRIELLREIAPRALGHDAPPLHARAGTEIDDAVGETHGVLVVLNDDEGVAPRLEFAERIEQPRVVAGMEANGRLVEDVEHALQLRTELRGEPDAL